MSKKTADFMSAVFVLYLRNVKGGVPYKKTAVRDGRLAICIHNCSFIFARYINVRTAN